MKLCLILMGVVCAHAALRHDVQRRMEKTLDQKSAEPHWIESIYAQLFAEMQQKCGSKLTTQSPGPAGRAFLSIVERLFPASGRSAIEVLFIDCPAPMAAVTVGATIIAGAAWLARAGEDDLWAVAAHEIAHRPADFSRRVVIEYHMPGIDAEEKARLATEMELRADAGAVVLLRAAGRDPGALLRLLLKETRSAPSVEMRQRMAALRIAVGEPTAARVPIRRP